MLGCCQLAALVRHGMVVAVIILLCEHGRDGNLASIGGYDRAAPRVKGTEDGGRRQALHQRVKTLLFGVVSVPGSVQATQPCQWRGNVSEAAEVDAQPHEAAQPDVGWRDRPIPHGRDLVRVHCHPCRDPVAKEAQLQYASA